MTDRPSVADGLDHALDPRVIQVQRIAGGITVLGLVLPLSIMLAVAALADDVSARLLGLLVLLGMLVVGLLVVWAYRWPSVAYPYASYRVDEQSIAIRRGVLWRRVITVPRSRVQHTDVAQGPLERYFGLGTLIIHTAGTSHARVQLPGLDYDAACRVRDHLLPGDGSDAV